MRGPCPRYTTLTEVVPHQRSRRRDGTDLLFESSCRTMAQESPHFFPRRYPDRSAGAGDCGGDHPRKDAAQHAARRSPTAQRWLWRGCVSGEGKSIDGHRRHHPAARRPSHKGMLIGKRRRDAQKDCHRVPARTSKRFWTARSTCSAGSRCARTGATARFSIRDLGFN